MRLVILGLLIAMCMAQELAVTKHYTDYLKVHVSWEVQDYEENIFRGWTVDEVEQLFGDSDINLEGVPHAPIVIKDAPEALDWTTADCTHEIRNQGNCGSCWAFSVSSVVSDRCCLNGKDYGWLAPQELVSCDRSNSGCNGGDRTAATRYVEKNGLVPEKCFPYAGAASSCPTKCNDGSAWVAAHVCKCKDVKICNGAEGIISCAATGPVAVGMAVYADFMYYKSGVYKWDKKSALRGYHAIRLVGYGADFWKCANSWGTTWGMQGYFMIAKGDCGIESRNPVICTPAA